MSNSLTLTQLARIIERHPEPFIATSASSVVTIDDIAYAVSKLAINVDAARDVVATVTGRPIAEIHGGLATMIQAAAFSANTISAYHPQDIANIFVQMVVPGFGDETTTIQ